MIAVYRYTNCVYRLSKMLRPSVTKWADRSSEICNLPLVSKDRLFEMYNETVQEIWHLSNLNAQLREENDALWKCYEEMMDQLYG